MNRADKIIGVLIHKTVGVRRSYTWSDITECFHRLATLTDADIQAYIDEADEGFKG